MKRKGSALIAVLGVGLILTLLATIVVSLSGNSYIQNNRYDDVYELKLAGESGVQKGIAQLQTNFSNLNSIPEFSCYDGTITSKVDFIPKSDGTVTIQATAKTSDGKNQKVISYCYRPPVIASPLFSLKRKFMVGTVTATNPGDLLDFVVKPGKDSKSDSEKFLLLNRFANEENFDKGDYVFEKNNGSIYDGIKTNPSNFFVFPSQVYVLPGLRSTIDMNAWNNVFGTNVYYYVSSSTISKTITYNSLNKPNDAFTKGWKDNKDKIKVIMVNGDMTIDFDYSDGSDAYTYFNNTVIYCTGKLTIKTANLQTGFGGNGNGASDLDLCIMANQLDLAGNNVISYVNGNTNLSSYYAEPIIRKVITDHINGDINWK